MAAGRRRMGAPQRPRARRWRSPAASTRPRRGAAAVREDRRAPSRARDRIRSASAEQPFGEPRAGEGAHWRDSSPFQRRISASRDALSDAHGRGGDGEVAPRASTALGQRVADARSQAALRLRAARAPCRAPRARPSGRSAPRSARGSGPRTPRPRAGGPPAARSVRARRGRCQTPYDCIVGHIRAGRAARVPRRDRVGWAMDAMVGCADGSTIERCVLDPDDPMPEPPIPRSPILAPSYLACSFFATA